MLRLTTVLAFLLPALAAQTDTAPATTSRPLNKAEEIAQKIEKDVEKIRGLAFKHPVKIGVYDEETLRQFLVKTIDKEFKEERVGPYARGLKALALIPADMDFKEMLLKVLTEQVAGFYDQDTQELKLIDRSGTPSSTDKLGRALGLDIDSIVMAHELTHALQDQHFGLKSLPIEIKDDDDLVVASQSLVEGDATLVMIAWPLAKKGRPIEAVFDPKMAAMFGMGGMSAMAGGAVADAPAFIREGLLFPYAGGAKFCMSIAEKEKSFAALDRALRAPPLSSEQVLHPDKFSGEAPDWPTALVIPDLSEALGMAKVTSNTLGELCTRILLDEKLKKKDATTAAAGWDGDRYVLYGKEGAPDALVWVSTWDSATEADQFEESLKEWLAALHDGKTSEASDVTSSRFIREDGTLDAIARKGSDVILLRAVPKDRLVPVLQKIFEETKRSERTKV